MNRQRTIGQFLGCVVVGLAAVFAAGCGGPTYSLEGAHEVKKLVIRDGDKTFSIDLGTAVGGGLFGVDGKFERKDDEHGVVVTGEIKGNIVVVESVSMKGKKLASW